MLKLKKKYIKVGGVLLVFLILLVIILLLVNTKSTDAKRFKQEYTYYNGKKSSDGYKFQKLKISSKNKVKYISISESIDIINEGTGLIYYGAPDNPSCRGLIETLLESVDNSHLESLLYVDMTAKKSEYIIEDDEIVKKTQADEDYYRLLDLLEEYLDDYTIEDDSGMKYDTGEKVLNEPLIVAVKEGTIMRVFSGIELNENQSNSDALTDLQISELEVVFDDMISKLSRDSY